MTAFGKRRIKFLTVLAVAVLLSSGLAFSIFSFRSIELVRAIAGDIEHPMLELDVLG